MKLSTTRAALICAALLTGSSVSAQVDLNGTYDAEFAVPGGGPVVTTGAIFSTQVGTALSMEIEYILGSDLSVAGTIDTGTGDFLLTGTCDGGALTFDGTGALDGSAFSGELSCNDLGFEITATRVSSNVCGDGVVQAPEECDDGNDDDGDCCSSTCTFEALGSACPAGPCIVRECNGAGTCELIGPKAAGTPCNGGACSLAECDGTLGLCELTTPFACDACSTCDPNFGCIGTAMVCAEPTKDRSKVLVKNRTPDSKDRAVLKWAKGPAVDVADFGDPTVDTDYQACVFVSDPLNGGVLRSVSAVTAPAGAGWSAKRNGFKYKSGDVKILMKAGPDEKPKIKVSAKGAEAGVAESLRHTDQYYAYPVPNLPEEFEELLMGVPARIEIRADNGQCWAADLDSSQKLSESKLIVKP